MKESALKKILDLYKDGKISADEAEKMIGSKADAPGEQGSWPDDGKLRIAAFVGRRKCADVLGCVNAGTSAACGNVAGSVSAGTSIRCGNIGGHASAGTSITCRQPGE